MFLRLTEGSCTNQYDCKRNGVNYLCKISYNYLGKQYNIYVEVISQSTSQSFVQQGGAILWIFYNFFI